MCSLLLVSSPRPARPPHFLPSDNLERQVTKKQNIITKNGTSTLTGRLGHFVRWFLLKLKIPPMF